MKARVAHLSCSKTARLLLLGEPRGAVDVWIVCHGYGQLATRFIRAFDSIAEPQRFIVAPEAFNRYYVDQPPVPARERRVGATWMTREDRLNDIRDYVTYLDRVAAHARELVNGPLRLRVLGFSQGAATVFRWAVLGETSIDELILWAGELPADIDMKHARMRLSHTRLVLAQGTRDAMLPVSVAARALLDAAGIPHEACEFDGGHELHGELLRQIAAAGLT